MESYDEIAKLTLECQERFQKVLEAWEGTSVELRSQTNIEIELGRLRLWANNIGAGKAWFAGLEYRLRGERYLLENVKRLLNDIRETLADGEADMYCR